MKHSLLSLIQAVSCFLVLFSSASPAEARDHIHVVGSSTVYPFSTAVAERHGRKPGFRTPVVESTGTGGGMKLFCGGIGERHPDITNASRRMKSSEWELCRKNGITEIVEITIGSDGIAFANSVKGRKVVLTKEQLWKAMAAQGPKPAKWSDISAGLPDMAIEILVPPPTSGTRDAWNELVMDKGCDPDLKKANEKSCMLMREDGAVVEMGENDALIVQKLSANPEAFGIFGFSYLDNNQDKIQPATIEGVEISLESIQTYEYPISRPLFFYVKKAHLGAIPGIREYIAEFTSKAALGPEGYLSDLGLVPLADDKLGAVRRTAELLEPMSAP